MVSIRNPIEVAMSVKERDHLAIDKALEIWQAYTQSIMGMMIMIRKCHVMRYEAMLDDPTRELNIISDVFESTLDPEELKEFKDFSTKGLHRQRHDSVELSGEAAAVWDVISRIREHQSVRTFS
jgi:hypothetical protein